MIGDVNIFLSNGVAELEIMVAEKEWHHRGIGSEAIQLIIQHTVEYIRIGKFQAKIMEDNVGSIALFKKLGFEQYSYCNTFKEYTVMLDRSRLKEITEGRRLRIEPYDKLVCQR